MVVFSEANHPKASLVLVKGCILLFKMVARTWLYIMPYLQDLECVDLCYYANNRLTIHIFIAVPSNMCMCMARRELYQEHIGFALIRARPNMCRAAKICK